MVQTLHSHRNQIRTSYVSELRVVCASFASAATYESLVDLIGGM